MLLSLRWLENWDLSYHRQRSTSSIFGCVVVQFSAALVGPMDLYTSMKCTFGLRFLQVRKGFLMKIMMTDS